MEISSRSSEEGEKALPTKVADSASAAAAAAQLNKDVRCLPLTSDSRK
jgi:hypothetical protein